MNTPRRHHEETDTEEFHRPKNSRAKLLVIGGAISGIILAVPIALGWVGAAFEIAKTPQQIHELQTNQINLQIDQATFKASVETSLKDLKESNARIEHALRIQVSPKQKEEPQP